MANQLSKLLQINNGDAYILSQTLLNSGYHATTYLYTGQETRKGNAYVEFLETQK